MPTVRSFTVLPTLPDILKDLEIIARNMFWSWNPEFIELFKRVDSNLWTASGHNPVKMLGSVSQAKLNELASNQGFLGQLQRANEKLKSYFEQPTWFENVCTESEKPTIAYFSAEFSVHECLPIYAGGLGILAGDHLMSASDLGVPLVGVGLLYQKGYFRQYLNIDGWQQEIYIENDFYNMPIELARKESGRPLTISVEYPGRCVIAQIWCVSVGRVKLYLLDTNIPDNSPADRLITASLYGGDRELRIRQEIMLGIGGLRALAAMDITPTICHINEGHAAFVALERIRQLRKATNMTFDEALEATKSGNVFTTHTLVKAGLDEFSVELLDKYFAAYLPEVGIDRQQFLALGSKTVLEHCLESLWNLPELSGVVLVSHGHPALASIQERFGKHRLVRAEGGEKRCHSVLNGLRALTGKAHADDWVLVHDAARPCVRQHDLRLLVNELTKLSAYAQGRRIEAPDVEALVSEARNINIFAMVDAIVEKRGAVALRLLRKLKREGAEGGHLRAMVVRQYRLIIQARELMTAGLPTREIGQRLGVPSEFVLQRILDQAQRYSLSRLRAAYRRLLEADVGVKRGHYDEELALELLVHDLARI